MARHDAFFDKTETRAMPVTSSRRCRSAAIIGAGGGFARELALGFAGDGAIVFGTASTAAEVQDLRGASGGRVSLAVCDISKSDAAEAWAGGVSDALDGAGLDILITSVVGLTSGSIGALSSEAIRHEFDVNLLGTLTVINAFLPALRTGRGRIVQINSWAAHVPLPFNGTFAAAEAAIESLLGAYRSELKGLGVDLVIATKGTPIATLSGEPLLGPLKRRNDPPPLPAFNSPEATARVIEIAGHQAPPFRVAIDRDADVMLRAAREIPAAEMDMFCSRFLVPS
jgi:NAD(P)-dependent dehydrogenase (short-subunit alcohol dehydrogenase family)